MQIRITVPELRVYCHRALASLRREGTPEEDRAGALANHLGASFQTHEKNTEAAANERFSDVVAEIEAYMSPNAPARRRPSQWVAAVLENNLREVYARGDDTSLALLPRIMRMLEGLPREAWGSASALAYWLDPADAAEHERKKAELEDALEGRR